MEKEIKSAIDDLPPLPLDVYERRKDLDVLRQEKLQMQEVLKQAKDEQTTCDVAHAKAAAAVNRRTSHRHVSNSDRSLGNTMDCHWVDALTRGNRERNYNVYRKDGAVPVLVPPLSFVPDGALCVMLNAFALCETFRMNLVHALNSTHGKQWPSSVLAELTTLSEFQKSPDASYVSLADGLLDFHNALSETIYSIKSNMPDLNPLTLETNIMNSYGESKLFEQNFYLSLIHI